MIFSLSKSEFLSFTRARQDPTDAVKLAKDSKLPPLESARLLRIWLERKVIFRAHTDASKTNLENPSLALTKQTKNTRGTPSLG